MPYYWVNSHYVLILDRIISENIKLNNDNILKDFGYTYRHVWLFSQYHLNFNKDRDSTYGISYSISCKKICKPIKKLFLTKGKYYMECDKTDFRNRLNYLINMMQIDT